MNNPGIYSLGDVPITTASTYVGDWVTDLDGMLALNAQVRLAFGSGGTTARVYLQTSLDQGTTIIDIACILLATASEVAVINFSGLTPRTTQQITPTDAALADDTAIDGVLGDRIRMKIVTTGTYAGSTVVSGRICAR